MRAVISETELVLQGRGAPGEGVCDCTVSLLLHTSTGGRCRETLGRPHSGAHKPGLPLLGAGRVEGLASGEQLPGTLPSPLSLRRSVLGEHTAGKACGSQMWGLALPGTNSANRRPC